MKGESLTAIKISVGQSEVGGDRWLYQLIEHLDTFTLLECRARQQVSLIDVTHTLILDHFDEAENPASLLSQILDMACDVKTLIVVSTVSEFDGDVLGRLNFDLHLVMGGDPKPPRTSNAVYVNDLDMAVRLLKSSSLQTA